MTYDDWYGWALNRFGDEQHARIAARSAAEVQQVGASDEAAERAAVSAVARFNSAPQPPLVMPAAGAPEPAPRERGEVFAMEAGALQTGRATPAQPPIQVAGSGRLKYLWIGGTALLACSLAILGLAFTVVTKRPVVQSAQPTAVVLSPTPSPTPSDAPYPNMVPPPHAQPPIPSPISRPTPPAAPAQTTTRIIVVQAPPTVVTQPQQPTGPALLSQLVFRQPQLAQNHDGFTNETFAYGQTSPAFPARQQWQEPPGISIFKVDWSGNLANSSSAGDLNCITYIDLIDTTSNVVYNLGSSRYKANGSVQSAGIPTGHNYAVRLTNCSSLWAVTVYE